jgi:hypothetical protein
MSASAASVQISRWSRYGPVIRFVALVLVATFLTLQIRSIVFRFVGEVGGPLNVNVGTIEGSHLRAGSTVTFGIFLHNDTDSIAVLDSVRLIELDPGLRIVGEGVMTTEEGGIGIMRGYPPGGVLVHPLAGAPIANSTSLPAEALIGVAADKPGRYDVAGVEVSYHVGTQPYRAVILEGFSVCASDSAEPSCKHLGRITRAQETLRSLLFPDQT